MLATSFTPRRLKVHGESADKSPPVITVIAIPTDRATENLPSASVPYSRPTVISRAFNVIVIAK